MFSSHEEHARRFELKFLLLAAKCNLTDIILFLSTFTWFISHRSLKMNANQHGLLGLLFVLFLYTENQIHWFCFSPQVYRDWCVWTKMWQKTKLLKGAYGHVWEQGTKSLGMGTTGFLPWLTSNGCGTNFPPLGRGLAQLTARAWSSAILRLNKPFPSIYLHP